MGAEPARSFFLLAFEHLGPLALLSMLRALPWILLVAVITFLPAASLAPALWVLLSGLLVLAGLLSAAGRAPLVLLDDLDAELDRERLAQATALFAAATQTVATSSRPEAFEGLRQGAGWGLDKGVISALAKSN